MKFLLPWEKIVAYYLARQSPSSLGSAVGESMVAAWGHLLVLLVEARVEDGVEVPLQVVGGWDLDGMVGEPLLVGGHSSDVARQVCPCLLDLGQQMVWARSAAWKEDPLEAPVQALEILAEAVLFPGCSMVETGSTWLALEEWILRRLLTTGLVLACLLGEPTLMELETFVESGVGWQIL